MAGRIRSIKPEILEDEKTAALSHLAWRLFVSLWLIADDYGNLRGDPVYVLGQTLWATRETRETIAGALEELAGVGLVARYAVRGQGYYHITGWSRHQKVDKPGKPRMPGPDEADTLSSQQVTSVRESLAESSRESRESLAPDLRPGPTTGTYEITPPACAIPAPPAGRAEQDLAARRAVQLEVRAAVERERAAIAVEHGLENKGLLAQDSGERDLANHLLAAGTAGLAQARDQALHAVAIKALEARRDRSLKGLTMAIFRGPQYDELVSMGAADVARAGPRSSAGRAPAKRDVRVGQIQPSEANHNLPDGEYECP